MNHNVLVLSPSNVYFVYNHSFLYLRVGVTFKVSLKIELFQSLICGLEIFMSFRGAQYSFAKLTMKIMVCW